MTHFQKKKKGNNPNCWTKRWNAQHPRQRILSQYLQDCSGHVQNSWSI